MKTPVFEPHFNKLAGLNACSFIKKRLQYMCFPENIARFLTTRISKNSCFSRKYSTNPSNYLGWKLSIIVSFSNGTQSSSTSPSMHTAL